MIEGGDFLVRGRPGWMRLEWDQVMVKGHEKGVFRIRTGAELVGLSSS